MLRQTIVCALLSIAPLIVQAEGLKIIGSIALKPVFDAMRSDLEKSGNGKLALEYGTSGEVKDKVAKGDACDVAIASKAVIGELVKTGKLKADGMADINKSGVGLAVKKGETKPPFASDEDVKRVLLGSKAIVYSDPSATTPVMKNVFQKLGIADQVQSKIKTVNKLTAPEAVAQGQGQHAFTQISEILMEPGVDLVAPLPPSLQTYTIFTAAACSSAHDAKAPQALIKALQRPEAVKVYQSKGLEPTF